jgi:hypothetical protein
MKTIIIRVKQSWNVSIIVTINKSRIIHKLSTPGFHHKDVSTCMYVYLSVHSGHHESSITYKPNICLEFTVPFSLQFILPYFIKATSRTDLHLLIRPHVCWKYSDIWHNACLQTLTVSHWILCQCLQKMWIIHINTLYLSVSHMNNNDMLADLVT